MSDEDRKLAIRYAPCLWFDRNEPFFPARFGVTVLREDGESPSFRRSLNVSRPKVKAWNTRYITIMISSSPGRIRRELDRL
ncbi:hypothetical protein [Paenibacillus tianjinensis]|uniref:Uncharacterized protein n=1 Tax=Paenibacillus tianjinensis TaxID=2810347 RepID=A0ABX7LDM1_9BACL|nr:hypothetical protein [Paenibacillus tianjinensis]QSF45346.1 hypothetical protein JRJ22_01360 [Paenibacillus tianjinensis]